MANAGCINAIGFDGTYLRTLDTLDSANIGVGVQYCIPAPLDDKRLDYIKYTDKCGCTCCITGENEILVYATNGVIKNFTLTNDDTNEVVNVKWNDLFGSNRAYTMVRYKTGSYPTSITDGTLAVKETTQNQYSTSGYNVSGLTDGTTYYFTAFAVDSLGTIINVQSGTVETEFGPSSDGLLAHYTLDSTLNDKLGNYNLAVLNIPTYTQGLKGNAISTGCGYNTLPIQDIFTIRCFFKGTGDNNSALISIFTSTSRDYITRTDLLRNDGNKGTGFYSWLGGTYRGVSYTGSSVWNNNWHHAVFTKNGTSGQLFIDGNKYTGTFGGTSANAKILTIKAKDWVSSTNIIDDVLVYNRVWTDSEVAKDYQKFQQLIG